MKPERRSRIYRLILNTAALLTFVVIWTEFDAAVAADEPESNPQNLQFKVTPRPWGDTYMPKSKPPARQLLVVNVEPLKPEECIALACLQV